MKKALKIGLLVLGCLMLLMGLVWIGQGTGYFPYPRASFMISQTPWIYRGMGLGLVGVAAILVSRRV
jgi:hypothetical protein